MISSGASPVLVTTNFSITYFAVANEVEGSGLPAWLLVTDAEGMSVLTAWAAGKFDAERLQVGRGPNIHDAAAPFLVLALILLCLNFLGDGLRDALDPRQRT